MPSRMDVTPLRMDKALRDRLNRQAARKGLSLSALIRMWLMERLEEEERKKTAR